MLEISSNVELRTLKLTNKAEQSSKPLKGASIVLYQGNTIVRQVQSDGGGDFSMMVPPDGDFTIVVSYPGCNPKKFQVSTKAVPENYDKDGWEPSFPIGGVIMAKPLYSIDYEALKQPMARIFFKQKGKVFDDDENYTDEILSKLKQIKAAEDDLISRFLEAVQAGDAALKKPDCPLAKAMYEKALRLIPGEEYPTMQLAKVGDCLKADEQKAKEQAEQKAREDQQKLAEEKARAESRQKQAAEKEAREKELADKKKKEEQEEAAREAAEAEQKKTAAAESEKKAAAEKAARELAAGEKKKQSEEEAVRRREADKAAREQVALEKKKLGEAKVQAAQEKVARGQPEKKTAPVQNADSGMDKKKTRGAQAKPETLAQPAAVTSSSGGEDRKSAGRDGSVGSVKSKKYRHSVPHVIGTSQYQQVVKEADEHYSSGQFAEAKALYTKALRLKPADAHATARLDAIKLRESKPGAE